MDKKSIAAIMAHADKISAKKGVGAVFTLGSKEANLGIPRWSTGIAALDDALKGGFPKGRMVEIYGPESSGKTSLGYRLCAQHPAALFIPAEGTFDAKRAEGFGNKGGQFIVYRDCTTAEDILGKIREFAELGIPIIVVDSVPGMVPKALYEAFLKDPEKQPQYGQLSKLFGRTLKQIEDIIERSGTTIVWLNQVRANMGGGPFAPKHQSPGGYMFHHFQSVRIYITKRDWIKVPNKNPASSEANEMVGIISKFKVMKSKICNPFEVREIPMFFADGYVSHDDIKPIRARIMAENVDKYKKKRAAKVEKDWDELENENDFEFTDK